MPTAIRIVDQFVDLADTPAAFSGAGSQLVRVNAGATALEFLDPASDFATQYALLAGRAGGSTLYGGTAANDDLTLEPTSHATKTTAYVLLAPTGGNVGIGTTAPTANLEIVKNQDATTYFNIVNSNTGASANTLFRLFAAGNSALTFGLKNSTKLASLIQEGNYPMDFWTNNTSRMTISNAGNVGIGTTAPDTLLHALLTDAGTDAVVNVLTAGHESSGTPAAGFGAGIHLTLESSTTAKQSAALLAASWIVATHASRTARLALSAYDSAGAREGIRIEGDGSEARLGFYGVTATARQLLATGAGATVDNVITALQTLGLLKQS